MRRTVYTTGSEQVSLRADEIDWFPTTIDFGGYPGMTHHLLVNDEDFSRSKEEKLAIRRANREAKLKCRIL